MFGGNRKMKKENMMDDMDIEAMLRGDDMMESGGQDDDVPAFLSQGEYIIPADVVAALGDGNPEAGAEKLDMFVQNVREHKMQNGTDLPPEAQDVGDYMGNEMQDMDSDGM